MSSPHSHQIGDKAKTRSMQDQIHPYLFNFWSMGFLPLWQKCVEPVPHPHPAPCIPGLSSGLFGRLVCWSRPINLLSHHRKYQPASVVCSNAWKQARLWPFAKSHLVPGKSSPWLFPLPQLWRQTSGLCGRTGCGAGERPRRRKVARRVFEVPVT